MEHALPMVSEVSLQCVKSNFGNPEFIPPEGRRVVERTFPRLGGRRSTNCNYGRYLRTAAQMITVACMMSMPVISDIQTDLHLQSTYHPPP